MFGFLKKIFNFVKDGIYNIISSDSSHRVVRATVRKLERGVNNPYKKDYYEGEYSPKYAKIRKQRGLDIKKFHLIFKGDFVKSLYVEKEKDKLFLKARDKPFLLTKYKSIFENI
jgi:hypothetical protein